MTSIFTRKLAAVALAAAAAGLASAQGGWIICDAPTNAHSTDFNIHGVQNTLMRAMVGLSGTVTHGGSGTPPGPCWDPSITGNVPGGMAFSIGSEGSIQTNFDDNMALTYGAPFEPARPWCFATINVTNTAGAVTKTSFGSGGIGTAFTGASGRYVYQDSTVGTQFVILRVDVIGDASRLQWTIRNGDAVQNTLGIWFGAFVAMLSETTGESSGAFGEDPYIVLPGRKPLIVETRTNRGSDTNFPDYADYYFDQQRPYGFRLENGPSAATADQNGLNSDADYVDEIVFGDPGLLIGGVSGDQTFSDAILPDARLGGDSAFLQKFRTKTVLPNATTTFIHYLRTPWGNSNYSNPYAVVVDGPTLIGSDNSTSSGLQNDGSFNVGVHVDNSGRPGFNDVLSIIPISTVRVNIAFPNMPDGTPNGLSLASGEVATKNIPGSPALSPLQMKFLKFNVQADGIHSGDLPYVVTVTPSIGPVKTLKGTITVASTPRIHLLTNPSANLISAPWQFADSSWEAVLGLSASDFGAFNWDPQQNGYVLSTAAERGVGTWIIYYGSDPSYNDGSAFYQSNPQPPTDMDSGAPQIRLHQGWNLIGDPYNYAFPLAQIVGVSDADNTEALTWQGLVNAGIVLNFLAYWDPVAGSYRYLQDISENMRPDRGYWIFVNTVQDLTIQFPPVFAPGLGGTNNPGSFASSGSMLWKLQLVARNSLSLDDQNFVGSATDSTTAKMHSILKPPLSPVGDLNLAIIRSNGTQNLGYASSVNTGNGSQDFKVVVSSKKGGAVNLTWPTINSLPSYLGATITDLSTGTTTNLRNGSSYVFNLPRAGTRTLNLHVQQTSTTTTLLSNLSRSLGNGSNILNYKLSTASKVTAKILTTSGREVVTLLVNRQQASGLRKVTWNLRDSANRPVVQGQYLFVVSAETNSGQLDTKQLQFNTR